MLVAKPAPEEKIRELASAMFRDQPESSIDSFLLPREESCNFQWNTVSTRNFALSLEWYLHERDLLSKHQRSQEAALSELLEGIVYSPKHSVIVDGEPVPVSVTYLRRTDNWISNYTAVSILQAMSRHLEAEYADLGIALSHHNPWLAVTRFGLERTTEAMGLVQRLQALKDGPQAAYLNIPTAAAFMNRTTLYEVVSDFRLSARRRRIKYLLHHTNYYYLSAEMVGWNAAVYAAIPQLFSQHAILRRIPGFNLGPADVRIEFPEGDYSGTWEIIIDYDITPIDRIRSWFSVGELQETVATLSAEVLELQRDRKALTEEAEQLAGQLIEAEKLAAVGRLSFGVGHDLRNTLATAINSGIPLRRLMADLQQIMGMLEEGTPTEETAAYMSRRKIPSRLANAPELYETMMSSLAQALDNVKALEGYAVQDGTDFQDVSIEDVIQRVLHDYREELEGVQVETSFEEREYAFKGNALKLYDIFQNLVSNAIEAMEEEADPILRITTQISEGVHRTTVEDNGCGMSEEVRRHAFEPFYTTRGLAEGRQRGLGLFNVWRLVEQHSGTIEIESESGEYTRLHICFRIAT